MAKKVRRKQLHRLRALGIDQGRIEIADDFDSPLPAEIMTHFVRRLAELKNQSTKTQPSSKHERLIAKTASIFRPQRPPLNHV
jgi:hypothetical protein